MMVYALLWHGKVTDIKRTFTAVSLRRQYCFQRRQSCVNAIIHKPLHLVWWNFARTCMLTTTETPADIKVIGQRLRSQGFLCVFCVHDTRNIIRQMALYYYCPRKWLQLPEGIAQGLNKARRSCMLSICFTVVVQRDADFVGELFGHDCLKC